MMVILKLKITKSILLVNELMKAYSKLHKTSFIVLVNLIVLTILMTVAEFGFRIYRLGLGNVVTFIPTFHSTSKTSNWLIKDPTLGYRLNPSYEGYNSRSVRHEEIIVPKPKELYRVIVLGDSVPWDDPSFASYIRTFLDSKGKFEVINAAVPGYTSYQEVLFYKKYLAATNPDLVIWAYCLNDNHRFLHELNQQAQMLTTREAKIASATATY
jgi:hypothetical protein